MLISHFLRKKGQVKKDNIASIYEPDQILFNRTSVTFKAIIDST